MKIIHKYVLREHAGPLVFALSALTSLLLLNYIAKQFGNLVGKGLPWSVIGEFFALSVPFTVAMTLPMAVLVSSLYAFSRLAAENEITALKASGVSLSRLTIPVLLAASVVSILMILFNDQVLPRSNHRLRTLQGDIARKKPTFALREQVLNEVSPGKLFLRANHLDEFSNRMREVTIYDLGDPLRRRTIYADSGEMAFAPNGKDLIMTLNSGHMLEISKQNPLQLQRLYFVTDYIRAADVANQLDLTSDDSYKSDREMSVCELQNEVSRNEFELDRARDGLRQALVGAAHEAATGQPWTMPIDDGAAVPNVPGAIAPRSRHRSLGRAYCDLVAVVQKWRLPKTDSKTAFFVNTAFAAEQTQDTTKPKKDTTQAKQDSIKATQDTTKAKTDSSRGDTAVKPNPAINPQHIQPNINPQLPFPVPGQPPGAQPAPAGMAPSTGALFPQDTAGLSRLNRTLPPSASLLVQPFIASAAIEGARSRIVESSRQVNQNAVELHKKFAISVACVVFVLIGAPIALRFPRGGVGLVIGVSLTVFSIYYIGLIAGEALADRGVVPPALAMWAANIILTIVGLVMLARIGREGATARGGDISELVDALKGLARMLTVRRKVRVA
ncbi:MAG: LptF/LptG family permease [Gemmatimonadaceae bacterium]